MNARGRVRLALTCQRPDRIPLALAFWEESFPEIAPQAPGDFFDLDVRLVRFEPPAEQNDFLGYLRSLPPEVHVGDMAQLANYHEWDYHPEPGPDGPLSELHTADALARYVFPDLTHPTAMPAWLSRRNHTIGVAWRWRAHRPISVAALRDGISAAWLPELHGRPGAAQATGALLTRSAHDTSDSQRADPGAAGVDILLLDDDVAMPTGLTIGLHTWREFFKPRVADVIRLARQVNPDLLIFYHSDGDFSAVVPDLVEAGVNVINPLQPDCMDALAIKRRFGDRLALWGTVGGAGLWDRRPAG